MVSGAITKIISPRRAGSRPEQQSDGVGLRIGAGCPQLIPLPYVSCKESWHSTLHPLHSALRHAEVT